MLVLYVCRMMVLVDKRRLGEKRRTLLIVENSRSVSPGSVVFVCHPNVRYVSSSLGYAPELHYARIEFTVRLFKIRLLVSGQYVRCNGNGCSVTMLLNLAVVVDPFSFPFLFQFRGWVCVLAVCFSFLFVIKKRETKRFTSQYKTEDLVLR